MKEIHQILSKYDVFTVGELPNTADPDEVLKYISAKSGELDMVFNFETVNLGQKHGNRFLPISFDNADFNRNLTKRQGTVEETDAWTTVFLENHDQGRSISHFASVLPAHREAAAKMLAIILTTLTGTLFLYQGQEIGMINAPKSWPGDAYKCVRSVNYLTDVLERTGADPKALEAAQSNLRRVARDHDRVPMQWEGSVNAGFSSPDAEPWVPALDCCRDINVANQIGKEDSVLEYWRRLLVLRKQYFRLFVYGDFISADQQKDLMMYLKRDPTSGVRSLTAANLSQ